MAVKKSLIEFMFVFKAELREKKGRKQTTQPEGQERAWNRFMDQVKEDMRNKMQVKYRSR